MTVKAVGGTDPVPVYMAPAYGRPGRMFHLVNLDTASTVYYEDRPGIDATSNQIPPLGSATFDGTSDVWMCTLVPGVSVLVQTGIPGQRGWAAGPVSAAEAIRSLGVPPQVPNITPVALLDGGASGSPYSVYTFPAAGRIWGVDLAGSIVLNNPSIISRVYYLAQLDGNGIPGNGDPLAILELGVAPGITGIDSDSKYVPFNGLPVSKNQQLYLIINGGTLITGVAQTASVIFFYSVP